MSIYLRWLNYFEWEDILRENKSLLYLKSRINHVHFLHFLIFFDQEQHKMFIIKHTEMAAIVLLHIFLMEMGLLAALTKFAISPFQIPDNLDII